MVEQESRQGFGAADLQEDAIFRAGGESLWRPGSLDLVHADGADPRRENRSYAVSRIRLRAVELGSRRCCAGLQHPATGYSNIDLSVLFTAWPIVGALKGAAEGGRSSRSAQTTTSKGHTWPRTLSERRRRIAATAIARSG